MLICFGAAWPFSIVRSRKARTTAEKSWIFLWIVLAGNKGHTIYLHYQNVSALRNTQFIDRNACYQVWL